MRSVRQTAGCGGQLTGGKPFTRYHDLLAAKDVDYILNATPEHWHSQVTIDAIEAGKHVYNEKPMTRTVEQAKLVLAKAKANPDIKVQVGVQGMSDDSYITANKYVKEECWAMSSWHRSTTRGTAKKICGSTSTIRMLSRA